MGYADDCIENENEKNAYFGNEHVFDVFKNILTDENDKIILDRGIMLCCVSVLL